LEKGISNRFSIFLIAIVVIVPLIVTPGCSKEFVTTPTTHVNTYTNPDNTIQIYDGELFTIALPAGRIVSYHDWQTQYDTNMLNLVDVQYKEQFFLENDPSSGGLRLFTFQAITTGETSIYMTYVENLPDQAPKVVDEKDFTIHIEMMIQSE